MAETLIVIAWPRRTKPLPCRGDRGAPRARDRRSGTLRGLRRCLHGARPMRVGERTGAMREARSGRLMVAAAAVFWSAGGLMTRTVETDAWTTVFWRGLFCGAFLVVVTALRARRETLATFVSIGGAGLGMAVCFAAASTCYIMALHRTSVANVLIIQSLSPFMAGLLGWAWMGERVAGRTWLAMSVALLGSAIMVSRYFYAVPAPGRDAACGGAGRLAHRARRGLRGAAGLGRRPRPRPAGPVRRRSARARHDPVHRGGPAHPGRGGVADRGAGECTRPDLGVARDRGESGPALGRRRRHRAGRPRRPHPGRPAAGAGRGDPSGRVAKPLVHRNLIGVGQRVGLAGHADHREQLAAHRLGHARLARARGVGGDAVVAAVGRAHREVDHLLGERIEDARRGHLLDRLPGAAQRGRMVGEGLPEIVDPVDLASGHDVVVDGPHLRAGV